MTRTTLHLALIVFLVLATVSCDTLVRDGTLTLRLTSNTEDVSEAQSGSLQDLRAVNVEITRVEIQDADGDSFDVVFSGSLVIDLLSIADDPIPLAFDDSIDRGTYRLVRITFSEDESNVVLFRGGTEERPLEIPEERVLVPAAFSVEFEESTEVLLQVEVARSMTVDQTAFGLDFVFRPIINQIAGDD